MIFGKAGLKENSFLNSIVNDFFEGKDHTKSQVITGITAAAQEVKGKIPILQKEEQNFLEEKQKWQDKNTLLKSLRIDKTFQDLEITLRNLPYYVL